MWQPPSSYWQTSVWCNWLRSTNIVAQSSDFPQATVAIDEIKDAGTFVEVEVLSDDETSALMTISKIETKLGLDLMEIVTRPYRDICMGY